MHLDIKQQITTGYQINIINLYTLCVCIWIRYSVIVIQIRIVRIHTNTDFTTKT